MKNSILIKLALAISFCTFINSPILSQSDQVVYGELLGAGLLYSVNFDTRFSSNTDGLGLRIGIGYMKREGSNLSLPIQLNYLIGKANNKLEVGFGLSSFFQKDGSEKENYFFLSGVLMYRYQPVEGHFVFRVGLSPIFAPGNEGDIISTKMFWIWPGVGAGFRF